MPLARPQVILPSLEEAAFYGQGVRVRRRGPWWVLPRGERAMPAIAGGSPPTLANYLGETDNNSSSAAVACLAAVPTSQLIVATGADNAAVSFTSQSITDSQSNPYTSYMAAWMGVPSIVAASNPATALTTSDHITYALTGASTNRTWCVAAAFSGCSATSAAAAYATNSANGSGTTVSVTSGSVKAGDLAVLFVQSGNATTAPSTPSGWTAIHTGSFTHITGTPGWGMFYMVPATTGTLSPTCSNVSNGSAWIAAFPAAASGGPIVVSQAVMRAATR